MCSHACLICKTTNVKKMSKNNKLVWRLARKLRKIFIQCVVGSPKATANNKVPKAKDNKWPKSNCPIQFLHGRSSFSYHQSVVQTYLLKTNPWDSQNSKLLAYAFGGCIIPWPNPSLFIYFFSVGLNMNVRFVKLFFGEICLVDS